MRLGIMAVCLLALTTQVAAQGDAATKEPAKASLAGSVVKEPSGEPLKKAIIELIAENQEEGGNYTATSDQDGHYKIAGIQPGRYRMFVERPGYIEVDQKKRRSQGVVLSFAAGQELKDQTLHMLAAAILTGRVLDEDGDPMPDVDVTVLRRKFASGGVKLESRGGTQTNDLGEYRIGGLLAGKYYVSASPSPSFQSLVPIQKSADEAGAPSPDTAYVTTYYPNTLDRAQAAAIELHPGDETPVDFSLARVHTARIRGSVAGLAPGAKAVVMLRARDSNAMFMASEVDKEGKFEIAHVAPGLYTVLATTVMADAPQSAARNIQVTDTNIDGLSLAPLAGAAIHGRIHFSDKAKLDASVLFVSVRRIDGEEEFTDLMPFAMDGVATSPTFGRVKADGSFELKDVLPGLYEIEASGDSKGMADNFVESVVTGTKEVTDTGLNVSGGTLGVDVTLSPGAGVVDGTVANEKKETIANTVVVAVPDPKYRKRQSHYHKATTDQGGHFTLHGLCPGAYTLYAWEVLEGDEYLDAEFLKQFDSQGSAVTVEKSSHQSVALKVIPAPADQP
ncbi:MAG: carboxypeptidase regulatory-like domain-containing protein [Terriglobales bacterium]